MNKNQAEITPVDILIITVGNRQVAWRCEDGNVRSLAVYGKNDPPPHLNELYDILGVERGNEDENKPEPNHSLRYLGECFDNFEQKGLEGDFSKVELPLDQKVLEDLVPKGLKHIILWGSDQPKGEDVGEHRNNDTFGLAKLMKGKINKEWPDVEVHVLHPVLNANNYAEIRKVAEKEILCRALKLAENQPFVLAIENKGSTPPIAQGLALCAAALVRQCSIIIYTPIEPSKRLPDGMVSFATEYDSFTLSEYFWPLERSRVISAWEKGNFSEAKVWLESHTIKYGFLHDLAEYLAISSNWEFSSLIEEVNENDETSKFEAEWLNLLTDSNKGYLTQLTSLNIDEENIAKKVKELRDRLKKVREDEYAETWESIFFIYVLLLQENYTGAFFKFAQILERLLRVKWQEERWFEEVQVPKKYREQKEKYDPKFSESIKLLFKYSTEEQKEDYENLFNAIKDTRDGLVHKANPMSLKELSKLWSDAGLEIDISSPETILNAMQEAMEKVIKSPSLVWNETMLYSLYKWGLDILKSEEINSQQPGN